jgi:hypothetical protein
MRRNGLKRILSLLKIQHVDIILQTVNILNSIREHGLIHSNEYFSSTRQQLIHILNGLINHEPSSQNDIKKKNITKIIKPRENKKTEEKSQPIILLKMQKVRENNDLLSQNKDSTKNVNINDHQKPIDIPRVEDNKPTETRKERIELQSNTDTQKSSNDVRFNVKKRLKTPTAFSESLDQINESTHRVFEKVKSSRSTFKSISKTSIKAKSSAFSSANLASSLFDLVEIDTDAMLEEEFERDIKFTLLQIASGKEHDQLNGLGVLQRLISHRTLSLSNGELICKSLLNLLNSDDPKIIIKCCCILHFLASDEAMVEIMFSTNVIHHLALLVQGYNLATIECTLWVLDKFTCHGKITFKIR